MNRPILVVGAGGQLGRTLVELATSRSMPVTGLTRADLDITDADAVRRAIDAASPHIIVNAAAYTAVDKAESNEAEAVAGNVIGPAILAAAAAEAGLPLIHISTDYVFDGTAAHPLTEADPVAPIGVYGRTKAEGEARVREIAPEHVILRTAWVYSAYGNNFLKTMLRLAGERDELKVVADQHGNPTAAIDIAEAILAVDRHLAEGGASFGTYHFAGAGITTWHGFASAIVEAAAPITGRRPKVTPITSAEFPTPVRRPANSALDSTRFTGVFGYRSAPWQDRTRETVARLLT